MSPVCLLFLTDIEAADDNSPVHEEPVDPSLHTTQNTSDTDTEHYEQPAEGDEEKEADDPEETKQEQKHRLDQSQEECDNNSTEVNAAVQPQHEQEAVPDQEEAQHEGETCRDSPEPEDTEQVETFFSTMSHRYENATQEGHIL